VLISEADAPRIVSHLAEADAPHPPPPATDPEPSAEPGSE
jgi:hypothetical protein